MGRDHLYTNGATLRDYSAAEAADVRGGKGETLFSQRIPLHSSVQFAKLCVGLSKLCSTLPGKKMLRKGSEIKI